MAKEIKRGGAGERKSENGSNPYFNLDAEKAFFDEVDEEVRNEKFKELVNQIRRFYSGRSHCRTCFCRRL